MIHGSRGRHGRRQERLHLVGTEAVLLQPQRQLEHILIGRARMRGDKVWNEVLLLARLFRVLVEHLLELVIRPHARLHHLGQGAVAQMLGGNLEITADMVLHQLFHVLRRFYREVVTHAGTDQNFLDARQFARAPVQLDER